MSNNSGEASKYETRAINISGTEFLSSLSNSYKCLPITSVVFTISPEQGLKHLYFCSPVSITSTVQDFLVMLSPTEHWYREE